MLVRNVSAETLLQKLLEVYSARSSWVEAAVVLEIGLAAYWREKGQWPAACRPLGDDDFECF